MIESILSAISEMLTEVEVVGTPSSQTSVALIERVKCAKIMLDKVIEGMRKREEVATEYNWNAEWKSAKPEGKIKIRETEPIEKIKEKGEYKIVVDGQNRIVRIDNLPPDAFVELDGVAMIHQAAIGKTFTSGKVL